MRGLKKTFYPRGTRTYVTTKSLLFFTRRLAYRNPFSLKMATSRDWCFTSFKLSTLEVAEACDKDNVKYLVCQHEVAPGTGKHHVQGFIVFKTPVRMTAVKNLLLDPALHCEKRKGTPQQVIEGAQHALRNNVDTFSNSNLAAGCRHSELCPNCVYFLDPYLCKH